MKKEVIYFTAKPNKTIIVHKGIFKMKSEKDLKNQLQKNMVLHMRSFYVYLILIKE